MDEEFLNTETRTRVLLTNHLWSRREKWYRVRKTEVGRSARGLSLQLPRAEGRAGEVVLVAEKIDDIIADHKVLSEG